MNGESTGKIPNVWTTMDGSSSAGSGVSPLGFGPHDILADDCEIEEEKIEITKSQLINAIGEIFGGLPNPTLNFRALLKKLGFKS